MYIPPNYRNTNLEEVKEFLRNNAFAILVSQVNNKPWATHIPLELVVDSDENASLVGHIAKANEQWQHFNDNEEVLAIFNGPHSYISSSWYQDEEVPTWNYIAVHVYGTLEFLDEDELLQSLHDLVDKYESNSKHPISLHDLSKSTMQQINGIVGFKIGIKLIEAAYKLSQGREHDHGRIIQELKGLNRPDSKAIADHMKKNIDEK